MYEPSNMTMAVSGSLTTASESDAKFGFHPGTPVTTSGVLPAAQSSGPMKSDTGTEVLAALAEMEMSQPQQRTYHCITEGLNERKQSQWQHNNSQQQ
jgi:hypothetical protein